MDRIEELNRNNKDILQPYRKLSKSKTGIINNHLLHFLTIGLAYLVVSTAMGVQSGGGAGTTDTNPVMAILVFVLSLAVLVGISSWLLSLYRAVIEKTANKDITLTKSSFIPDFGEKFFKRGGKYLLSTFIYGFGIGIIAGIFIGFTAPVLIGVLGIGTGVLTETLTGGFVGILLGVIFIFLIVLLFAVLISPFIFPITTLYVFYGDDLGVFEAIKLSFKLGKQNYGKLLKASIKVSLVNVLGLLVFGVGIVYTSVWGILIEVDAVSSILGVSLREGSTFEGKYIDGTKVQPTKEPEVTTAYTVEEVYDVGVNVEDETNSVPSEVPIEGTIEEEEATYEESETQEDLGEEPKQ